jgi:hypothetical protein
VRTCATPPTEPAVISFTARMKPSSLVVVIDVCFSDNVIEFCSVEGVDCYAEQGGRREVGMWWNVRPNLI